MEIREREDINVISIQTQDEEGILYKEYVSTKRRIQFLKEYIESLRMLLERKKAKEILEDDFRIMAGDCLLVIRRTEEAKYALDEEEKRIDKVVERSLNYSRVAGEMSHCSREEAKKELKALLCTEDKDYLEAKKKYEAALKRELEEREKIKRFAFDEQNILDNNMALVRTQIIEAYEEIESLEHKKVEIIEKMDYIVYGRQKVKK